VTVHRLPTGKLSRRLRAARGLVLGSGGLARTADLLIAGDPEAMPVAWAAGRRHPRLSIELEPSSDPARRPEAADLAVLTPWYPSPQDSFAGAFVQATTAAVRPQFDRVSILHTENWYHSPGRFTGQFVAVAAERQVARSGAAVVLDTAEGELTRVAVPTEAGAGYVAYADAQARRLRAVLPTGRIEAPLVHAHTGMLAGVVAARLARPDARIVVTEHSTFLPTVFRQPGAQRQYAQMLQRVDVLLCVSRYLYDQLSGYFPEHVDKLTIVPNAIDFDRFTVRPSPPRNLSRWLYVGRLMEHKGVLTLVEGFARIAAQERRVTLTLIGSGPLEDALDRRIAQLRLGDRITRRPAVPPDDVPSLLHGHDLLVHASRLETFGMTVVEAIATGTPVLVAGSQGPRETLVGLENMAGLLIEPSEDPEVIADGYRRLRASFDALDLPGARAELRARYGFEAVAARLREVYALVGVRADMAPPERETPAGPVVGKAVDPSLDHRTEAVHAIAERGIAVDPETPWPGTPDDRVEAQQLGSATMLNLVLRLERQLVAVLPAKTLSVARRLVHELAAPGPEALVRTLQRVHRRVAEPTVRRSTGGSRRKRARRE
jgi:glycogen(starch) synthase